MKLMLEAKRVVRIVKASSFVGATILSSKMGTVIYQISCHSAFLMLLDSSSTNMH